IAIFFVIVFHAMTFNIFGGTQQALDAAGPLVTAITLPIGIIGSWAAIFVFLSSIANTAVITNQLKKGAKPSKVLLGAILPSLAIIIINYIFMILFSHVRVVGEQNYYSIINGSIELLKYPGFNPRVLLFNSSLIMIGFGAIICNILLIVFRKQLLNEKSNAIYWIFMIIGVAIVALTPLLDWIFHIQSYPSKIDEYWEDGKYAVAYLVSLITGPRHSIFPYVAYGPFGAVFGTMILRNVSRKKFMMFGFIFGAIFMVIGALLWIPLGVPILNEPKYSPNLYILDIGLLFCFITLFTVLFYYRDHKTRIKIAQKTVFVRRYSMATMTIFVFESPISTGMAQIFNLMFSLLVPSGIVSNEIFGFIVYLPLVFFLWHFILKGWEKVNFKGSIEWITNEIVGRLRGRKSDKLNVQKILYNPVFNEKEE
ncbi:MAG: hypothetical protein ACTSRD_02730, partial [Promethearchaeota archaeon]